MSESATYRRLKLRAVSEAAFVFVIALAAVVLTARSPLGRWERELGLRPYAEYSALALVPLLAMLVAQRPPASFGITRSELPAQIDAALKCVMVFAAGKAVVFVLGARQAIHSVVEPIVALAVIAVCARLLRPHRAVTIAMLAVPLLARVSPSALFFYPFVLGPAEELLFRGYIQSRLNVGFGRPMEVGGARIGAGLFVTSALFALFHVVNLPAIADGRFEPLWVTAIPTFAWGLAFGFVRERTGSLLPAVAAHGIPQGIAWTFLGR